MDRPVRTLDEMRAWSVSRTLPHDQVKIWEALTDREGMRHWSSEEIVGPRLMGAQITIARRGGAAENGVIIACERPRFFSYSSAGESFAWEVVPRDEGGSHLTLSVTQDGDAAAPADETAWEARRSDLESRLDALATELAAHRAGSLEGE